MRRFSDRVENYVRYRPGYPGEVLGVLREEVGLTSEALVADVGSGTGILSKLFLRNGSTVLRLPGAWSGEHPLLGGRTLHRPNRFAGETLLQCANKREAYPRERLARPRKGEQLVPDAVVLPPPLDGESLLPPFRVRG